MLFLSHSRRSFICQQRDFDANRYSPLSICNRPRAPHMRLSRRPRRSRARWRMRMVRSVRIRMRPSSRHSPDTNRSLHNPEPKRSRSPRPRAMYLRPRRISDSIQSRSRQCNHRRNPRGDTRRYSECMTAFPGRTDRRPCSTRVHRRNRQSACRYNRANNGAGAGHDNSHSPCVTLAKRGPNSRRSSSAPNTRALPASSRSRMPFQKDMQ